MDWNGFWKCTCGDTGVMGVTGVTGVVGLAHWSSVLSVAGRLLAMDVPRTRDGMAPVLGRIRRNLQSLDDVVVAAVVNLRTKCSDKPSIAVEIRKGRTVPASLFAGLGFSTVAGRSGGILFRDPGSKFKLCDGL